MILQKEIKDVAQNLEVPASIIDKDWMLGHFIKTIYSFEEWKSKLVFKGGTCLRKCYIKDYHFSEGLDFTSTDSNFKVTEKSLVQLCKNITAQSEAPVHLESLRQLKFNATLTGYEAKIKFWGADHPRNQEPPSPDRWTSSIKLEIILFEKMIFKTEEKNIIHQYSDKKSMEGCKSVCYSIEEIISEKLRALIQRTYTTPRDYFDLWFLVKQNKKLDWKEMKKAFIAKLKFKNLTFKSHEELLTEEAEQLLNTHWENTLRHQLNPSLYVEAHIVIGFCKKLFKEKFA